MKLFSMFRESLSELHWPMQRDTRLVSEKHVIDKFCKVLEYLIRFQISVFRCKSLKSYDDKNKNDSISIPALKTSSKSWINL